MAKYWYSYKTGAPSPCTPSSRILTVNWNYVGAYSNVNCPGLFSTCCAIYATGAAVTAGPGTHPSARPGVLPGQISLNLQSYLASTIGVSKRYPITPGGKSYVYNKS